MAGVLMSIDSELESKISALVLNSHEQGLWVIDIGSATYYVDVSVLRRGHLSRERAVGGLDLKRYVRVCGGSKSR